MQSPDTGIMHLGVWLDREPPPQIYAEVLSSIGVITHSQGEPSQTQCKYFMNQLAVNERFYAKLRRGTDLVARRTG